MSDAKLDKDELENDKNESAAAAAAATAAYSPP
jgi:hypothetical protein